MNAWAYLDDTRVQARTPADSLCHIAYGEGPSLYCLAPNTRPITCQTGGASWTVCPDCRLPVCDRCRNLALLDLSLRGAA